MLPSFCRTHQVEVEYIGGDLLNKEELETLVSEVLKRHPLGIDILINNAGKIYLNEHYCIINF